MNTFDRRPGPDSFTADSIIAYAANEAVEPAEVTDDLEIVAAQRDVIKAVHGAGGEVVASAHTYIILTRPQQYPSLSR